LNKALVVVGVVAVAGALGFAARHLVKDEVAAPAEVVTVDPAETPALPPQPTMPENLPEFLLADREGQLRSLQHWAGQPLMVNFWATWCGPCRREIPLFNELRSEYSHMKLEIVGIAVDFRDEVLAYEKENPISYPLLIGEEDGLEAVQAMGVAEPGFPFTVFADSQQRILMMKTGELHRDDAELILDRLQKVDSGALPLADARAQISEGLKELATRRAINKTAGG
jgi:thiol-disulfide isomerase/thioredoxin